MALLAGFLGALDEDGNPLPRTLEEQEAWVTSLHHAARRAAETLDWLHGTDASLRELAKARQVETDASARWLREHRKLERMRAKAAKASR